MVAALQKQKKEIKEKYEKLVLELKKERSEKIAFREKSNELQEEVKILQEKLGMQAFLLFV